MNNETQSQVLTIESKSKLTIDDVQGIQKLVEDKLKLKVSEVKQVVNEKILGGLLVCVGDYKLIISTESISGLEKADVFVIESNKELTDTEKKLLEEFAHNKFTDSVNQTPKYLQNKNIISGTMIRFRDEEIDLTLDKILDKVFSKI